MSESQGWSSQLSSYQLSVLFQFNASSQSPSSSPQFRSSQSSLGGSAPERSSAAEVGSNVTTASDVGSIVGNTNYSRIPQLHVGKVRSVPYFSLGPGEITAPRCKGTGAILRCGLFECNYVQNVFCLLCKSCDEWVGTLPKREGMMVNLISFKEVGGGG